MITIKNIEWYKEDPSRLLQMKPFTRGGTIVAHPLDGKEVMNNATVEADYSRMQLRKISQDLYLTEYDPSLHHILLNESIPHIKVAINGSPLKWGMMDMTQTASYQKLIHSAHVRSLTANELELHLCDIDKKEGGSKTFEVAKTEWQWRNMDWYYSRAINICKKMGNVGVLFSFDKERNKYDVSVYSYRDGYQMIPNYDEYGREIARSITYIVDGKIVIDTYDNKKHYRFTIDNSGDKTTWKYEEEVHGFTHCPLLIKREKPAWEYAESTIEMFELMSNIQNIALKRFGTFALVFTGDMDADSFKRDSSTLIINLAATSANGEKQDAKVLNFPESTTMNEYLDKLEQKISIYSSTSFITPKDIQNTGSGGNGIALAMSNDYALATQSASDWSKFVNDMFLLHQEGLDLETNGTNKYGKLRVRAKIVPWALETNNMKVTNLAVEAKWLSMKTILEKTPDAAPDEEDRIIEERGALVPQGSSDIDEGADKATKISKNKSNLIVDNKKDENKND